MTRELEARLKLTASDRTGKALTSVSGKLDGVARKAAAVNRAQTMMGRASVAASRAMAAEAAVLARVVAPAAALYGAQRSFRNFASTERALTRIAITADATDHSVTSASKSMRTIAQEVALPLDSVREGLETLVAAGKSLDDSMAMLPAVARTAQASDAALTDIASSAAAIGDSFKIASGEMQGAFDILAMGGKLGKFELPDMAQYLPSLAPQFATLGYEGQDGLKRLVALLQTVRMQTGQASEAATALSDLFGKMETDETQKKFMKFGVNIRKEMARARREGEDTIETFINAVDKALGGDLTKLPQLIGDKEAKRAVTALLQLREPYKKFLADLANAEGTVARDVSRVVANAEANIQRLSNSWQAFGQSTGGFLASFGVPEGLLATSKLLDDIAKQLDDISRREGGMLSGGDGKGVGPFRRGSTASNVWGLDSWGYLGAMSSVTDAIATEPGDIYPSTASQSLAEFYKSSKDVLAGAAPPPLPLPAPARSGGMSPGGSYMLPRPRPDMDAPSADIAWDASFALPRARGDEGASALPDAAVAAADSLVQVAESGRVVAGMFGDSEALRALLGGAAGAPSGGPAAPSLQDLDDDALARRLGETREPVRGIGPVSGDATLGSDGSFRSDAQIDSIGDAADDAADKLRQLPEAMNPGAFAAAGQAGATAFSTAFGTALAVGVRNAFAAAETEARAGAARLGAIAGSVRVSGGGRGPAPVNADRGPSMSELGVP